MIAMATTMQTVVVHPVAVVWDSKPLTFCVFLPLGSRRSAREIRQKSGPRSCFLSPLLLLLLLLLLLPLINVKLFVGLWNRLLLIPSAGLWSLLLSMLVRPFLRRNRTKWFAESCVCFKVFRRIFGHSDSTQFLRDDR